MNTPWITNTKIAILVMLCTMSGCSQEVIQNPTPYDGCCGTEAKVYEVEDYKVFIPNIITPNGDGINDAFYPICNKMELKKFGVSNYWIYNDTGKVIYALEGLEIEDAESWGFKGIGYKDAFKPKESGKYAHIGKFRYTFEMWFSKTDGTPHLERVEGEGCVVRCDNDAHVIKEKTGCYFPIQGMNGIFNPTLSAQEENCIK